MIESDALQELRTAVERNDEIEVRRLLSNIPQELDAEDIIIGLNLSKATVDPIIDAILDKTARLSKHALIYRRWTLPNSGLVANSHFHAKLREEESGIEQSVELLKRVVGSDDVEGVRRVCSEIKYKLISQEINGLGFGEATNHDIIDLILDKTDQGTKYDLIAASIPISNPYFYFKLIQSVEPSSVTDNLIESAKMLAMLFPDHEGLQTTVRSLGRTVTEAIKGNDIDEVKALLDLRGLSVRNLQTKTENLDIIELLVSKLTIKAKRDIILSCHLPYIPTICRNRLIQGMALTEDEIKIIQHECAGLIGVRGEFFQWMQNISRSMVKVLSSNDVDEVGNMLSIRAISFDNIKGCNFQELDREIIKMIVRHMSTEDKILALRYIDSYTPCFYVVIDTYPPSLYAELAMGLKNELSEQDKKIILLRAELFQDEELLTIARSYTKLTDITLTKLLLSSLRENPTMMEDIDELTIISMYLVCHYYKQKYNIDMYAVSNESLLPGFIESLKRGNKTPAGIIVRFGRGVHVTPCVYWSDGKKNILRISDSVDKTIHVAEMPGITIQRRSTRRQADVWSCKSDALIHIKDALRMTNLAEIFADENSQNPAELWKASQMSGFMPHSHLEQKLQIAIAKGKTLQEKRKETTRTVLGVSKSGYLLNKGHIYKKIAEDEYAAYSQEELQAIYDTYSGRVLMGKVAPPHSTEVTLSVESVQSNLKRAARLGHTYEFCQMLAAGGCITDEIITSIIEGRHRDVLRKALETYKLEPEFATKIIESTNESIQALEAAIQTIDSQSIITGQDNSLRYSKIEDVRNLKKIMQLVMGQQGVSASVLEVNMPYAPHIARLDSKER